jgi:regulator of Ty1 transposition protein 109
MPPSNNAPSGVKARWKPGNPLPELAKVRGLGEAAPPRCLLPRFPDDPKARFMQDLDDEAGNVSTLTSPSKRKSGKWSTIRDLERFWEAMEFRQECSSGRLVGFVWLVMRPTNTEGQAENGASQLESVEEVNDELEMPPDDKPTKPRSPAKRRRKPLSGPIIPRQPRLKGGSSSLTGTSSDLTGMVNSIVGEGIMSTKEGYDQAMQTLLHLDFGTLDSATHSTSKWISDVTSAGGVKASEWCLDIEGTAESQERSNGPATLQAKDLGGMIRRKRKSGEDNDVPTADVPPAVNVLGSGMIRKKPKKLDT